MGDTPVNEKALQAFSSRFNPLQLPKGSVSPAARCSSLFMGSAVLEGYFILELWNLTFRG